MSPAAAGVAEGMLEVGNGSARGGIVRRLRLGAVPSRAIAARSGGHSYAGYSSPCAFTHSPAFFVRQGFSIVPHVWVPEKIQADCTSCVFFRNCEQYAMLLPLDLMAGATGHTRVAASAA